MNSWSSLGCADAPVFLPGRGRQPMEMFGMLVKEILAGAWLGIIDRLAPREKDIVTVVLRRDLLDADTLSFVLNAEELLNAGRVCLVVRSEDRFRACNEPYLASLDQGGREVAVVQASSTACVRNLVRTKLLILTGFSDLPIHRLFLRTRGRKVVRVYHGVITKSYGRLKPRPSRRSARRSLDALAAGEGRIHARSVLSDVELHFRAAAEGMHPASYRKWGYPRYDRVRDLLTRRRDPVLPDAARKILAGEGRRNILYAPTHKDRQYTTTLFPFPDFDADTLRAFLREHRINLLLRMHLVEEHSRAYDDLVDGEFVHNAGHGFSPSPIEMFPYVQLLITDYSSIYMDFLPFDRPILFVHDNKDAFDQIRGLAFDYESYFPGQKTSSMRELLAAIEDHLVHGRDEHAHSREFVRGTFLPNGADRFMVHMNRLLQDV